MKNFFTLVLCIKHGRKDWQRLFSLNIILKDFTQYSSVR